MDLRGGAQRRPTRGGLKGLVVILLLAGCLGAGAALADLAAAYRHGDDRRHLDLTLTYLGQTTPRRPVVVLFGGSAARESTVSDRSWRRQIVNLGGPRVLAFNLGAASQSYSKNVDMVQRLPDVPTLVIIGVNVGRYTSRPPETTPSLGLAGRALTLAQVDDYDQHRFSGPPRLSRAQKSALVTRWLRERYPVFRERFSWNAGQLDELVAACRERGFGVVLLNLPLNLQVIRQRMDAPRSRYRRRCLATATRFDVPWVDFVARARLVNADFADNWHLVEPGRVKWQKRLSRTVVAWLRRYQIGYPTPEPTPSPTPSPTPTASPAAAASPVP